MLAKIISHGICGVNGYPVEVEVDISSGLPSYEIVGLPDLAVRESKERVRSAIKNSGFSYPLGRITVNLAPADLKKEGSLYDLPIAVGILAASGAIAPQQLASVLMLGELALDGALRGVSGVFPMMLSFAALGGDRAVIPAGNAEEASYIPAVKTYAAASLREVVAILTGESDIEPVAVREWSPEQSEYVHDFCHIKGQQGAKRAAEIAAAGNHNLLLVGTPGSGKTMLAKAIPSILPELTFEEASEITKIHSVVSGARGMHGLAGERPFRSPHHTASSAAVIGGGLRVVPGEVSLAHYGVLFLDEFPEFRHDVLEALRQPLEDGAVTIARANARVEYPANFMLVAAMNPCPCGNLGSRTKSCTCSPSQIHRYGRKISGPLLDRIDLRVTMSEILYMDLASERLEESSVEVRARVNKARKVQLERYKNDGLLFNAQLSNQLLKRYCRLTISAELMLQRAYMMYHMSARAYTRILKVARTIADLDGVEQITEVQIAEALQYRGAEQDYYGGER